jgi:hypothetical protein
MLKYLSSEMGRNLYLMTLDSLDEGINPFVDKRYFRLLVVLNDDQIPNSASVLTFAENALEAGARTIFCAGTAGEKVHDIFDEVISENETRYWPEPDDVIITTWHPDETLDDVLWQAFTIGTSVDRFEADTPPVVACLLSKDPRVAEIEEMGQSLHETFKQLLSQPEE